MILIAAGSSLPFGNIDSQQIVLNAFFALGRLTVLRAVSALYATRAWPDPKDPPFINAVASVETDIRAEALLEALHAIEAGFGRRRRVRNAPRTLDLDLLAYGDRCQKSANGMILPHPRLHEREFVLAPLCDIAPNWRHPETGTTASSMFAALGACQARKIH
jgi:2-amino-4-hydroxy-6-hydroxymethyldihydropteridine diphosphokinase